jgi:hypothetical protein
MVLSGIDEVLLGVIPIEDRDVIIDPFNEKSALPPDGHYLTRMKVKIVTSIV